MKNPILFCWLGMTDLRAASGATDVGLGPVAQAVAAQSYEEVALLNNWEQATAENYITWLFRKNPMPDNSPADTAFWSHQLR